MTTVKIILQIIAMLLPWHLRRHIYQYFFRFQLSKSSKIGLSLILCDELVMKDRSKIGHFNVIKGLKLVELYEHASIGRFNWITGFPLGTKSRHFATELSRVPALLLGQHSAITHRHIIDCTNSITIGRYTTVAGFRSQLLTHSIAIRESMQRSAPICIGEFCFIGSGVIVLPGSTLPSYSVLGAGAILNKSHSIEYGLYSGVPAQLIKSLEPESAYFVRSIGYVD